MQCSFSEKAANSLIFSFKCFQHYPQRSALIQTCHSPWQTPLVIICMAARLNLCAAEWHSIQNDESPSMLIMSWMRGCVWVTPTNHIMPGYHRQSCWIYLWLMNYLSWRTSFTLSLCVNERCKDARSFMNKTMISQRCSPDVDLNSFLFCVVTSRWGKIHDEVPWQM